MTHGYRSVALTIHYTKSERQKKNGYQDGKINNPKI